MAASASTVGIIWFKAGKLSKEQEIIHETIKANTLSNSVEFKAINYSLSEVRESVARIEGKLSAQGGI